MKSDPPKKRKTSPGSESGDGEPSAATERPAGQLSAAPGGGSSAEPPAKRSATGGTNKNRRDRDKQTRPPVRIVPELAPEPDAIPTPLTPEHIAQRAYELYEAAGFEQGREVEHWLEAERQLKAEQRRRKRS